MHSESLCRFSCNSLGLCPGHSMEASSEPLRCSSGRPFSHDKARSNRCAPKQGRHSSPPKNVSQSVQPHSPIGQGTAWANGRHRVMDTPASRSMSGSMDSQSYDVSFFDALWLHPEAAFPPFFALALTCISCTVLYLRSKLINTPFPSSASVQRAAFPGNCMG